MLKNKSLKRYFYRLISVLLVSLAGYILYLNTLETIPGIDENQVKEIIVQVPDGSSNVINKTFTDRKVINRFVKAFNKAIYYRNDVDTTHPISVFVILKNGEKIWISGGSQNFQTVSYGNQQYNIQGWTLECYLRQFKTQ